jgi:peptidoglycan/LPS O-acetylase OafA/YrhL
VNRRERELAPWRILAAIAVLGLGMLALLALVMLEDSASAAPDAVLYALPAAILASIVGILGWHRGRPARQHDPATRPKQ